jgi:hypothetical protein
VLKRRGRGFHDAASDLSRIMFDFCKMERRDRIALRNEVDKRSWDFDWAKLGKAYHTTHELAIERVRAGERVKIDPSASRLNSIGMVSADDLSRAGRMSQLPSGQTEPKPSTQPASVGG